MSLKNGQFSRFEISIKRLGEKRYQCVSSRIFFRLQKPWRQLDPFRSCSTLMTHIYLNDALRDNKKDPKKTVLLVIVSLFQQNCMKPQIPSFVLVNFHVNIC